MKKILLIFTILFLVFWGCEEEQDTIPPTVSISSHSSGQTVNEIITITVTTQDNEGISKVEFIIDDSLVLTDTDSPYQYDWNTTQYEDFSEHSVKVISYDNSDNSTESQPIMLIVDNGVYLWGEYYSVLNTTELDLSNNQLTGEIPPEIWNLTNLTYLELNHNELTGSIPPGIGNLTNLTGLSLYSNELTGSIPPEIGNLTNLERLYLKDNQLTGSVPSAIGNLTNLISLSLHSNQFTGDIPPEIWNLTNLTYLLLNSNQLTGEIPPEIGDLANLTYLYLDNNQIAGSIPSEIGHLTNLTSLRLFNNQLMGEIPESICYLDLNWISNNYFNITNNQLCPPYPACIENYVGDQDTTNCD